MARFDLAGATLAEFGIANINWLFHRYSTAVAMWFISFAFGADRQAQVGITGEIPDERFRAYSTALEARGAACAEIMAINPAGRPGKFATLIANCVILPACFAIILIIG
jgi:hypothetical protein